MKFSHSDFLDEPLYFCIVIYGDTTFAHQNVAKEASYDALARGRLGRSRPCCRSQIRLRRSLERAHRPKVPPPLRYLTKKLNDSELALDIAQEVFVDSWRLLDRLVDDALFTPWLFKIAHYHILRSRRRQSKQGLTVSIDTQSGGAFSPADELRMPDDFTSAVAANELIQQCLNTLSSTLRHTLLRSAAGLTAADLANELGITLSAAERRLSRARAEFRNNRGHLVS